jgi:hypothetical protein
MASTASHGWQAGYIVAMIVVGLILIIGFGLYEACLARMLFLKYKFLNDRTILGARLLDMTF